MRARLCVAAASSTTSTMSSSSQSSAARGRRPMGGGFYDGPWSGDRWESGGAFVSWRIVSEENYGHRGVYGGDARALEGVTGLPPGPGFRFRPPHLGPRPLPPPSYGPPLSRHPWQPPPPGFGPQHPPVYGPCPPLWNPLQTPPRDFHHPQPRPRARPADYRSWVPSSLPPPPPDCERFRVLSYNILADYLARDHQPKLYSHIPTDLLDWEWRKSRLLIEFGLWSPDIMCLQEVDKFQDLEKELARYGYNGIWKMRTGNAVDGCALFWRTNRFVLRHQEHIEFAKLGLRDNVAQICVLESKNRSPADNGSEASSTRSIPSLKADHVVICNIHVLYNPKRGDIKLGQVRLLLDRAYSVSKIWNDAPVIICGDFNCIPKSPLYNFISGRKLSLSGLARTQVSGQHSACIYPLRPCSGSRLYRGHPLHDINDGKAALIELDNHQPGVKDSSIEEGKNIAESSGVVMTFMETERVDNHTSTDVSSQRNLHTTPKLQSDEKCVEDSFIVDTITKHDEQVNNQHFVTPGTKGMLHGPLDPLNEAKHVSLVCTSCTSSTSREDEIDFTMTESNSHSCHGMLSFEGNKDTFNPENDSETCLELKSESDKFPDEGIDIEASPCPIVEEEINSDSSFLEELHGTGNVPEFSQGMSVTSLSNHPMSPSFPDSFTGQSVGEREVESVGLNCNISTQSQESSKFQERVYDPFLWTPMEIEAASGNAECTLLEHNLNLKSAYTEVKDNVGTRDSSGEPQVTSYNRQFMGTVDYIWHSEELQTVHVLDTIPKHVLRRTSGFPTKKWGSDHLALACEFAFKKA